MSYSIALKDDLVFIKTDLKTDSHVYLIKPPKSVLQSKETVILSEPTISILSMSGGERSIMVAGLISCSFLHIDLHILRIS